jgi:LysM repeat protein
MKRLLIVAIASVLAFTAVWGVATPKSRQEVYIEKYSKIAVDEMYRSGIPASITLAQGLLESAYGYSELAVKGNNHFGIKCHNWKGKGMYYDDDAKGECFRVYKNPEESYRDHSDFLRYRDRYKFLFEYEITDYKAWAYGLKKAGYATDPAYPTKLIKLIETYKLYEYDKGDLPSTEEPEVEPSHKKVETQPAKADKSQKVEKTPKEQEKKVTINKKVEVKEKKRKKAQNKVREIPEPPAVLERPVASEQFNFTLSRPVYEINNVPFVYAEDGETYASIAQSNGLFHKEILRFNDLENDQPLDPGTIVYLAAKKSKAAKNIDKHIAEDGETLRGISQRFGIKLSKLLKINSFTSDYSPREGDEILLR